MEKGDEKGKQSREIKILRPESVEYLRNSWKISATGVQRVSGRLWEVGQEGQAEPASISPLDSKAQD